MENNSWKFIAACCDAGLRKRKEEEEEKTDQLADRTWVKWKTRVGTGSTSISTARRIPSLEKEEEEDGRFSYTPVWEQKFVGRPPIIMVDANYLQPLFFPSLLLVDKFMKIFEIRRKDFFNFNANLKGDLNYSSWTRVDIRFLFDAIRGCLLHSPKKNDVIDPDSSWNRFTSKFSAYLFPPCCISRLRVDEKERKKKRVSINVSFLIH